jgi:hypothetical protein
MTFVSKHVPPRIQRFLSWCSAFPARHIRPRWRVLCSLWTKVLQPFLHTLLWVALLACLATQVTSDQHDQARWLGLFYQCLGLFMVAYGLWRMRRDVFARPSLLKTLVATLRKIWSIFRPARGAAVHVGVAAVAESSSMAGAVQVSTGLSTVKERLKWLENKHKEMDKILADVKTELRQAEKRVGDKVDRDNAELRRLQKKLSRQVDEVAIGGLHLEFSGLLFLVLGVWFATAPEVLAPASLLCLSCWFGYCGP